MRRFALALAWLLCTASFALADWTHVRSATANAVTGSSTPTLTITAPTSGDVLVGNVQLDTGIYLESVTDNQANLYSVIGGSDNAIATFGYRSLGLITNGPTTLTFHLSAAPSSTQQLVADEFTPPAGTSAISLDGTTAFTFLGLAGAPSTTVASAFQNIHSDVLIYGAGYSPAGALTAGTGFTLAAASNNEFSEWQIQSSASSSNSLSWASNPGDIWGVAFGIAPVPATSWEPIQTRHVQPTAAAGAGSVWTLSATLPAAMSTGHIFVGTIGLESGVIGDLTSVTDNLTGNYPALTPNTGAHFLFWSGGLMTTTPQTITVTVNASQNIFIQLTEFAPPPHTTSVQIDGGGPALQSANAQGTSTTPAITTTASGDLVYTFASFASTGVATPLGGISLVGNWGFFNADGYLIEGAPGSVTTSYVTSTATGPYPCVQYALALSATLAANGGGPTMAAGASMIRTDASVGYLVTGAPQ